MFHIRQKLFKRISLHQPVRFLIIADPVYLAFPPIIIGFPLQIKFDQSVRNRPFGRIDIIPEIIEFGKQEIWIALGRDIELASTARREIIITFRLRKNPQETVHHPNLRLFFTDLTPSPLRPFQLVFLASDKIHLIEHTAQFREKNHFRLHHFLRLRPGTDIAIELCRNFHHWKPVERVTQLIRTFEILPQVADQSRNRITDRIERRLVIIVPFYMPDAIERTITFHTLLFVFSDNKGNGLIGIVCWLRNRNQSGKRLHIQPKTTEIGLLPIRTLVAIPRSGTRIPIGFGRKQHIIWCLKTIFLIKLKHFLIMRLLQDLLRDIQITKIIFYPPFITDRKRNGITLFYLPSEIHR